MRSVARPKVARLTAGACLGLALAACGTTVPVSQQSGTGLTTGDGLGGAASTSGTSGPSGSSTGSALGGSTTGGSTGSGSGGLGTTGGGAGTGTGSSVGGSGGAAPGAVVGSTKPIQVGITFVKDAAAGLQAIGVQGATLGDMQRYAQAFVDEANAHGGLGGRKIQPVFFGYDVNPGSASYDQQDAQACALFTQDNHIEVAIVNFAGSALNECMRKRGIPQLEDGPTGGVSESTLKQYSDLVVLGGFNLDRRARQQVPAMVREKYFSAWDNINGKAGATQPVKVGVITYDYPGFKPAVQGSMLPALKAAGYAATKVVYVPAHDSYDDLSKMQPQINNAVLDFRASGITHVIIYDDNGVASLFFMQAAQNQKYHPRYGINSGNNMQVLIKLVDASQLNGAIGIGWDPSFDIADAKSPTSKWANSARRSCYQLMVSKKISTGQGFNETSEMMYCSVIRALKNRWDAMPTKAASNLIASINTYGSSFVDPQVDLTWLSPTQHDGNGGVYDYYYDTPSGTMKYSGGIHALPRG